MSEIVHSVSPVSYTHLDVYKRQGIGRSSLWRTGRIAEGILGYFKVCFDLLVIPVVFIKQK